MIEYNRSIGNDDNGVRSVTNGSTIHSRAFLASLRYHPWGTVRYANGTTPTKYQFTGQYSFAGEFGLIDFKARYYDPDCQSSGVNVPPIRGNTAPANNGNDVPLFGGCEL